MAFQRRLYVNDLSLLDPTDPEVIEERELEAVNEDSEAVDTRQLLGHLYDVDRAAAKCTTRRGDELTAEEKAQILAEIAEAEAFKRRHGGKV